MQNKPPRTTKHSPTKVITITTGVALLLYAVVQLILFDLSARNSFAKLSKNMDVVAQNIMSIQHAQEDTQKIFQKGNGLFSRLSCLPDTKCPTIQRTWYVPMDQGSEQQGVSDILKKSGYAPQLNNPPCVLKSYSDCYAFANNQEVALSLTIASPASGQPAVNVSPKVWTKVIVNADLK